MDGQESCIGRTHASAGSYIGAVLKGIMWAGIGRDGLPSRCCQISDDGEGWLRPQVEDGVLWLEHGCLAVMVEMMSTLR